MSNTRSGKHGKMVVYRLTFYNTLTPTSAVILEKYLRIADYAHKFEWPWTNWRSVFLLGVSATDADLESAKEISVPVDESLDNNGDDDDLIDIDDDEIEDFSDDDSDEDGAGKGKGSNGKGKSKESDELDDDPNENAEQQ